MARRFHKKKDGILMSVDFEGSRFLSWFERILFVFGYRDFEF